MFKILKNYFKFLWKKCQNKIIDSKLNSWSNLKTEVLRKKFSLLLFLLLFSTTHRISTLIYFFELYFIGPFLINNVAFFNLLLLKAIAADTAHFKTPKDLKRLLVLFSPPDFVDNLLAEVRVTLTCENRKFLWSPQNNLVNYLDLYPN